MDRGLAPTSIGGIHDVVVDEGARLNEFEGGQGGGHLVGVLSPRSSKTPVGEGRSQPLPAAQDEGLDRFRHGTKRGVDRRQERALLGEERGERGLDPGA